MEKLEKNIIDFSELGEFIDVPIKYYSTGMYARLAFTVATEIDPEILIIDEIFAGGDINFVDRAVNRINNLIDSAKIVIMVSHSMDDLAAMCDRVVVLKEGEIVRQGTPAHVFMHAAKLNEIGAELSGIYPVKLLPSDFKKKGGYLRSIELSREYGLYRQNYCGCVFSKQEAQRRENEKTN